MVAIKQLLAPVYENKKYISMLAIKSISRNLITFWWIETARRCMIAIEAKDINGLKFYAIAWLLISLLGTIWQFTLKKYGRVWIYYLLKSVYKLIYQKITRVDPQIYEEKWTGKISNLIAEGALAWSATIDRCVDEWIMFITSFSVALRYLYSLLWLSYVFGGLEVIILFAWYAWYFEKKVQVPRKQRHEVLLEGSRHRQKVISHKQDILVHKKEMDEREKQASLYEKTIYFTHKIVFYITLQNIWLDIKNIIAYILYGYIWFQIIIGNMSIATLTTLLLVLNNIFNQISTLVSVWQELSDNQFKIKTMNEFLDGPQIIWYEWWIEIAYKNQSIACKNISFTYSKWGIIFKNFNLSIAWGKITALVGSSGAWKSTLIKIIAGYLHPEQWAVCIGDHELPNENNHSQGNYISLESYYKHIWYLTQEPSVFDGSIRDNLMYATPDKHISDDELQKIILLSKCERIYNLKDQLDTQIGEKWIKLSGGQRQRLAIAKIMIKNPNIILLDEPTSALDSFAEEEVTNAMNNLFEWRTVIIIAHRLQTVKHADNIIVLGTEDKKEWAQILEQWNHTELLAKWWYYAKMLELQSGF